MKAQLPLVTDWSVFSDVDYRCENHAEMYLFDTEASLYRTRADVLRFLAEGVFLNEALCA